MSRKIYNDKMVLKRSQFSAEEKVHIIQEVRRLIRKRGGAGLSIQEACKTLGVNRTQYYRWACLYKDGDMRMLRPRSRRPHTFGRKTSTEMASRVIAEAQTGRWSSATALCNELRLQGHSSITPKTVIRILEAEGLYGFDVKCDEKGRKKKVRKLLI